ncbi:MAG: helix-turn-helix transcriptional regulator, partial [Ruminococcaceae bacterium]|nr:helix-turn-helix transcriptional regulator [Oscillospiraceae bacterium]
DDFERFCDYFWRFSRIAEDDRYSELEGISLAMLMLIILLRVSNKAAARPDCAMRSAYVKKAVSYLYTHYADPVCLDDVACFINISSCYLSSLFTEYAGCSFVKFLRQLRIDKAKQALSETNRSVLQIAHDCGFGSISTFERAFRTVVGISPTDFRKQNGV